MRLAEALTVIKGPVLGYRVHFEHAGDGLLRSDYFPERDEPMIEDEEEAWELARKFAARTRGRCVNLYVVDQSWCPVPGYRYRKIENR
jgi:hypothetical protein